MVYSIKTFLLSIFKLKVPLIKSLHFKRKKGTESRISINDEIFDEKLIGEKILFFQNSAEVIDHICDDNGNNLFNTK